MDIPTNLGEVDTNDLASLEAELIDATSQVVLRGGELSAEDQELAVQLTAVRDELNRRETVEDLTASITDAVTAQVLEQLSTLAPAAEEAEEAEEADEDEADEDEADEEPEAEAEAPEPVAEAPSPDQLAAHDTEPETPAPVGRVRTARLARAAGRFERGQELTDASELAESLHDVARGMAEGEKQLVARYDAAPDVQLGDNGQENTEMLQALVDDALQGGAEALVASGGWITPSEVAYSFFAPETMDGLLNVPTVGVNRGGLRFITGGGPQIGDAIAATSAFWVWDETTDITPGETVKTRYKIPAPSWTDVRLAAYGVALDHGNLASRSFSELTTRWLSLAPTAHEHEINRIFIAAIASASTARDLSGGGFEPGDFAATLLGAAEFEAQLVREKYRMSENVVIDCAFPAWVKKALRSSVSRRAGWNGISMSDSEIATWFTDRSLRAQFVYDWQQLPTGTVYEGTGSTAKVEFLVYPAGTWVKGTGGSLDLGVTRDSTLNETNDHTALWTEQFLSIMKFGPESRRVKVLVKTDGVTGGVYEAGA